MHFIKGEIQRKIRLSRLELRGLGIKNEVNQEISFRADEILNISSYKFKTAIVNLKAPPFENNEDFHIVCNTNDLLNSKYIMNSIIDKILNEVSENGALPVHKGSPPEYLKVLPKMEALDLVKIENHTVRILKNGIDTLNSGGFEKWSNKQNQPQPQPQEVYTNSTVFKGDGTNYVDQRNSKKSKAKIQSNSDKNADRQSFIQKWWRPIMIGIIVALSMLFVEYGILRP